MLDLDDLEGRVGRLSDHQLLANIAHLLIDLNRRLDLVVRGIDRLGRDDELELEDRLQR